MNSTFSMADIRQKRVTSRRAVAMGEIFMNSTAYALIKERRLPKGDALTIAEIAGIQGAKNASQLMPLCHPLALEKVMVQVEALENDQGFRVYCEVAATSKTGVEMEALAGVNAALLTIYDLTKPVDAALRISNVRLLFKEGGKTGVWIHPEGISQQQREWFKIQTLLPSSIGRAVVLTLSDRASRGIYEDRSGPEAVNALMGYGIQEVVSEILPDEEEGFIQRLKELSDQGVDLVICTGSTGLGPRDIAPEALQRCADKLIPGIGELFRSESAIYTRNAWLSRASAGIIQRTLVICLPGSPRAVTQGLEILNPLFQHAQAMIRGESHS